MSRSTWSSRDPPVMKGIAVAVFVAVVGIGSGAAAQTDSSPPAVATDELVVSYQPQEDLALPLFIDELDPQTVLTVRASGFDAHTTGTIKQCVGGSPGKCRNELAVRFDNEGDATFQYLITDDFGSAVGEPERCRLRGERCTIELGAAGKLSVIDTVFLDQAPPPGRLIVTPRSGLLVGDTITVTASQFQPGAELTLMICAAPSTSGTRCGAPGPEVPLTVASDGTARAVVAVDASEVGADRVACGRRVTCRMVVISDQRDVRARPVVLSFADSPGADYATTRVIIGITAALALALLAGWLIRSTDWEPPRESDSTSIDEANYADLDLEAALFEEQSVAP